jgi:predicted Zn finger-like uncharacterized protein
MAKNVIGNFDIDIECPACGKPFTISSKDVGKAVKCPHCKESINLKDNGFSSGIKSAEDQIRHMLDSFKF